MYSIVYFICATPVVPKIVTVPLRPRARKLVCPGSLKERGQHSYKVSFSFSCRSCRAAKRGASPSQCRNHLFSLSSLFGAGLQETAFPNPKLSLGKFHKYLSATNKPGQGAGAAVSGAQQDCFFSSAMWCQLRTAVPTPTGSSPPKK